MVGNAPTSFQYVQCPVKSGVILSLAKMLVKPAVTPPFSTPILKVSWRNDAICLKNFFAENLFNTGKFSAVPKKNVKFSGKFFGKFLYGGYFNGTGGNA